MFLFYSLGGAKACDGSIGPEEHHRPPLIFNLDRDIQEQEPLDVASREYQAVLPAISRAYAQALEDIATDNTTVADYSKDPAAVPCCSTQHVACRCHAPTSHTASLDQHTDRRATRLCKQIIAQAAPFPILVSVNGAAVRAGCRLEVGRGAGMEAAAPHALCLAVHVR